MSVAPVAKQELLERLAAGHAARLTVVTPNRRLAQELAREFDSGQNDKDLPVWETADVLPFSAFVERLYEDALYSDLAASLPLLLTPAQEQTLWEAAIHASRWGEALLAVPQAAADCRRAWTLAHGWRIACGDGLMARMRDRAKSRSSSRKLQWAIRCQLPMYCNRCSGKITRWVNSFLWGEK